MAQSLHSFPSGFTLVSGCVLPPRSKPVKLHALFSFSKLLHISVEPKQFEKHLDPILPPDPLPCECSPIVPEREMRLFFDAGWADRLVSGNSREDGYGMFSYDVPFRVMFTHFMHRNVLMPQALNVFPVRGRGGAVKYIGVYTHTNKTGKRGEIFLTPYFVGSVREPLVMYFPGRFIWRRRSTEI
jgi:hypothetical protein